MTVLGAHPRPVRAAIAVAIGFAITARGSSDITDRAACATTKPHGPRPPRIALLNLGDPIARASDPGWYGNGALWTELPPPTQVSRDPHSGMLGIKMGWFRARPGLVTITARPVHGPPARFSAHVGTPQEYGPTGFAASGLEFARPGCWQLRARLAGHVLALLLYVPSRNLLVS